MTQNEVMTQNEAMKRMIRTEASACEAILIGLGEEWAVSKSPDIVTVYNKLNQLVSDKDYFIVTTETDAKIFESGLDDSRITAPCGNDTWKQCSASCTKDIWEAGEVLRGRCPHCGAPLIGNTRRAETYIEEGYLPQWKKYMGWLSKTLNRKLLILELGVGFAVPTVIRWPFEKTVAVNKKARMYRIHEVFPQLSSEMRGNAVSIRKNSVDFFKNF